MATEARAFPAFRLDRNELAGAFGGIGTDLPLLIGMTVAAGLKGAGVLIMFGVMQLVTGAIYRMPMPVQPLKAMAAIVIAERLSGETLFGAGLAIGVVMLVLAVTGLVDWCARVVPRCVVRGIQFGLGTQLVLLALREYVPAGGVAGYWLAAGAFGVMLALVGNRRYPAAVLVILLGLAYAVLRGDLASNSFVWGFSLPSLHVPRWADIVTGFFVLALPQMPLSLGNSILATSQVSADLFPQRPVGVRKLAFTYSFMNLVNPFFGGVPTCHGAGGMAGHYVLGGRTGATVIIAGAAYVGAGLLLGDGFSGVAAAFPMPVLGVLLLFEGLTMTLLVRDVAGSGREFPIALLVGLIACGLPYGYVIGMVLGTGLDYLSRGRFAGLSLTQGRFLREPRDR
jgi:hypothetical protein